MEPIISSEIVVAYSQCPRKAYLLMFSPDKGEPHEYVKILEQERCENQERYVERLKQKSDGVEPYTVDNLRKGHDVLVNAHLQVDGLEASCSALTKVEGKSALGKHNYEPTICVGTHTISKEQKLEVAFVGHVLERLQNKPPMAGRIIGMNGSSHGVKLENSSKDLWRILEPLKEWMAADSPEQPPIILNKHCSLCPFHRPCQAQAENEDNLSLLDHMTPKVMKRYHRKGIFTVNQMSYLFTPRRRRKGSKHQPIRFNLELQALAIRTSKIYVHEMPELTRHPVELYLDFEGIPDQRFHYLIGLLICEGEHQIYHDLWADTEYDEERIWNELLKHIERYPEAPIYHYGSYEPKAIAQLVTRYETPADGLIARLVNVNTFIYGKLYFPVRSNTLKELGAFVGASWSRPDASGLQSLVWRYRWEKTLNETYKETLKTYNAEDCQALFTLMSYLTTLRDSAEMQMHVDFADRPKQHATERGEDIHRVFDTILKSAQARYANNRVRLRSASDPEHNEPKKRGGKKGHQAYQRILPTQAGKVIRVTPGRTCPKHKGQSLHISEHMAEHPIIDLHFTQNGCRKTITKYVGEKGYCQQCDKYYDPPGIEQFEGRLFGHALQAWVIYQRMILRLPYRAIIQVMEDMFAERANLTTILKFFKRFAQYYVPTERLLIQRLLQSPFIHADETKIDIQGTDYYVWVFTDGTHVIFKLTATREATIVHEMLENYEGVLISDFYPGYDAVPCRQQKCLVHLIRDLNDDLWSNPFNLEFETFVFAVKSFLVPIFEAVETYGLKRRHLHKFHPSIDRFYKQYIVDKTYTSETTIKFQKRFLRYRASLFAFLDENGVPWQNNTAERALRHIAVQRKISGSFFEKSTHYFLLLLGVSQTCQFQDKSFLKFLLSKEFDIDAFKSPKRMQTSRPASPTRKINNQ